jgi:hypothetical protein
VSEIDLLNPTGLLFERKQIPQFVVNIRIWRKTMEPLEATRLPYKQEVRGSSPRPPTIDSIACSHAAWLSGRWSPGRAHFSPSYDRLRGSNSPSPWYELIQLLRVEPTRYEFVDAAQLVKHALGLLAGCGAQQALPVYLFWESRDSAQWPECRLHRMEADDLANRVNGCSVRLLPMSYRELWAEWNRQGPRVSVTYFKISL